jgi:hypothetical protein
MRVPKLMQNFLKNMGFCHSYDTSRRWLRENAASDRIVLAEKVRRKPMAVVWDNLIRMDKKAEETSLNQGSLQQNTSALMFALNIPRPEDNALDPLHRTYNKIMEVVDNTEGPGLPRELLFKDVDYRSLDVDATAFLHKDQLSVHIPMITRDLVFDVLKYMVGDDAIGKFKNEEGKSLEKPVIMGLDAADYLKVQPHQSDVHTCPTMDIDETTLDGTALIFERLLEYVAVDSVELNDCVVFAYGNQLTYKNLTSLKSMRIRESKSDRLEDGCPKHGALHPSMAMLNAVMRCNWGKSGNREPGSLSRFAAVLGRSPSAVNERGTDYGASYRFVDQVLRGFVAAALLVKSGANTIGQFERWVERNNWHVLVHSVVQYYFSFGRVAFMWKSATEKAKLEYDMMRKRIMEKPANQRTTEEQESCSRKGKTSFIQAHIDQKWDMVLENGLLFMQQALILVDFHQSMRRGEVGRMEMNSTMMMLCFHGCGKSKYAALLLERMFNQPYCWTPEHCYIDLHNNVVNESGREPGGERVDETLEHVKKEINVSRNPRSSWQSNEWQRNVISPNIIPFRKVKNSVLASSDTSIEGVKHAQVDARNDILTIMELVLREGVLSPQAGRCTVSATGAKVPVTPTVDRFDVGSDKVLYGGNVETILKQRQDEPPVPPVSDLTAEAWVEEMESLIIAWNLGWQRVSDGQTLNMSNEKHSTNDMSEEESINDMHEEESEEEDMVMD